MGSPRAALARRLRSVATAVRRSRLVRPRASFVRHEAVKRPVVGTYRLTADRSCRVFVRHDGLDAWTLEEVFGLRVYALPAVVRRRMSTLGRPPRVLDLGANVGLASLFLSRQLGRCTGTAFEPDPANADLLERCLAANGLRERWRLVRACAGNSEGRVRFRSGHSAVSGIAAAADESAIDVPLKDVLGDLERCDLAKIDIEGGEWSILTDPRFAASGPAALVLEYHRELCPAGDPRGAVLTVLHEAGYETSEVEVPDAAGLPAGQGLVWAWRPA